MTRQHALPPLVQAVKREIAAVSKLYPPAKSSWQAELALRLAAEVGRGDVDSLSSRVSAGKLLAETLAGLRALAPDVPAVDRLDEIGLRRARRVKAS